MSANLPEGLTSPQIMSAIAMPPSSPPCQPEIIAPTFSLSAKYSQSTTAPELRTITVFGNAAVTRSMRLFSVSER